MESLFKSRVFKLLFGIHFCPTLQTLMEDGKREAAVSMLPIIPEDSDSGRTYTCRVLNPAAPAGRQTSVTINVQRECPGISLPIKTTITTLQQSAFYVQ